MIRKLPKAKICTLFITHACNLNCIYCFEKYKDSQKKMSVELAKQIVLDEFEKIRHSSFNDALKIDLFGGEPLMNFAFIKEFTEWLVDNTQGIPYIIYATTNGTLLDEKKKEWFRKYKDDFVLVMSVDGDSVMQLANRGCSTSQLPIEFVHELWPDQPFKMTISRNTIRDLANGVITLVEKGYYVESRLAQGEDWLPQDAVVYQEELEKIASFYLTHRELKPMSLFTRFFGDMLSDEIPLKFCGSGTNMTAYDVDGESYPCHMFGPIVLGRNAKDELAKIDFSNPEELIESSCLSCKMVRVCPSCIGFNFYQRGSVAKRDKTMCRLLLAEAKVISAFQIQYYMARESELKSEDLVKLKAALLTYKKLNDFEFDESNIHV